MWYLAWRRNKLFDLGFGIFLSYSTWTITINKNIRKKLHISKNSSFYRLYKILITFFLVSFAWIFFRASDASQAFLIIKKIMTSWGPLFIHGPTLSNGLVGLSILLFLELRSEFLPGKLLLFENKSVIIRYSSYLSAIILILLFGVFDGGQFIYFKF